jgi:hypothetical protein
MIITPIIFNFKFCFILSPLVLWTKAFQLVSSCNSSLFQCSSQLSHSRTALHKTQEGEVNIQQTCYVRNDFRLVLKMARCLNKIRQEKTGKRNGNELRAIRQVKMK